MPASNIRSNGKRAAIIGAGPGGLVAACALTRRGWQVDVYERRETLLPEEGYALACFENLLQVLEAVGAYDGAVSGAMPVRQRLTLRHSGEVVNELSFTPGKGPRMYDIARSRILQSLADTATRQGARLHLATGVARVSPEGRVEGTDGVLGSFDLVVIANGVFSDLPEQLGLKVIRTPLDNGVIRAVLPNHPEGRNAFDRGIHREVWSGKRRMMIVPYDDGKLFIALSARISDKEAIAMPVDKALWTRSFPQQANLIAALPDEQRWDQFFTASLPQWSTGKVAVLGDAAHAQPPNLGQGAACAMMNAISLAWFVSQDQPLGKALKAWEARERPLIEHTQKISRFYGSLLGWPDAVRALAFRMLGRSDWMTEKRLRTARYRPIGLDFPAEATR